MTDNEIIKALECCCEAKLNNDCKKLKCPFFDYEIDNCTNVGDMEAMYRFALDLINRQKAEIKELNTVRSRLIYDSGTLTKISDELYQKIKAKVVKEFAERLKEISDISGDVPGWRDVITNEMDIDNLVKEIVGDS